MLKHHRDKRWQETYALRCLMIFAVVFMVTTDFSDFVVAEQKKGAMSPGFYLREEAPMTLNAPDQQTPLMEQAAFVGSIRG